MIKNSKHKAIVISASADIGAGISLDWLAKGWQLSGTYRTVSPTVTKLRREGMKLFPCDLASPSSVNNCTNRLGRLSPKWDVLLVCPGSQVPVGPFLTVNYDDWEKSVIVNFTAQLRAVRNLLPLRNKENKQGPCVIFFAGGGTNSATVNYSAYTVSKIALIKMVELLAEEIPDTRFAIIGPGWVKTKIHQETLLAGKRAGDNYRKTIAQLAGDNLTPLQDIIDCCNWIINAPRQVVSGRNFSVVFDRWGTKSLEKALRQDPNMYKLRRAGNERKEENE